jgi:hypothetical protein
MGSKEGVGTQTDKTPAAKFLYRSIFVENVKRGVRLSKGKTSVSCIYLY